jgi:hypothetical protein
MTGKEQQHERVCTFMVASDKAQASQNEIRTALESNDDDAKVQAMQKAIAALLNGEQLPQLFITIVRYVLPSENHMVQKLLLLYLVSRTKTHLILALTRNSLTTFLSTLRHCCGRAHHSGAAQGIVRSLTRPVLCLLIIFVAGNYRKDRCKRQTTSGNDFDLPEPP